MALWGNNDNKGSGGTVTLDYTTLEVVGSGTTFGQVGAAATGDVIRFGIRGGGGTYFGDAVIVGIASTTSLSICSICVFIFSLSVSCLCVHIYRDWETDRKSVV